MQAINQPKQWMYITGSKAGEAHLSKPFDNGHGTTVFCACYAGFQSCIGPEETHLPPFCHGNHYMLDACNLLFEDVTLL